MWLNLLLHQEQDLNFEGYIFVGSASDYESIDIDAVVEADDVIIQSDEIEPRIINNITSSTTLSVDDSAGFSVRC